MHLPNEAVGKVPTADRGAVWWSIPPTQNISCTLIRPEPDKTFRMSSIRGSLRSSVNEFSQHVVQRRALGLELEHRRALRNLVLQAGPYKLLHYLAVLRRREKLVTQDTHVYGVPHQVEPLVRMLIGVLVEK